MPLLGQLALWLALLLGVWGVVTGISGARHDRPDLQESARRATIASAGAMAVAVFALLVAAWRQDFLVAYVAAHADRTLAPRDAWLVLLDGWPGQWLIAGCILAAGLALASDSGTGLDRRALAYGTSIGMAMLTVAVIVLLLAGRPFDLQSYTPLDGQGLSQRLYDLDARLAFALRCLAYPTTGIAAAWSAGARLAGHRDQVWSAWARTWAAIAWVLLSAELLAFSWVAWRGGSASWLMDAFARPALPLWLFLGVVLHVPRSSGRVAAYLTRAGVALVAVGLVGAWFGTNVDVQLRPGDSAPVAGLGVTYLASSAYPVRNQIITLGLLELRRGDRTLGRVSAVRRQQFDVFGRERFTPAHRAGSRHDITGGVRIGWAADTLVGDAAVFNVTVAPLASWLWLGWWLLVASGLAALWPAREQR